MKRRVQRGWIGIDFGCRAVKIAQLLRAGDTLDTIETLIDLAADEPVADGRAVWPPGPALGNRIRTALEDSDFTGRQVGCVLSMPLTDLRSFKIPPASPSDRRAMIQNELATLFHEEEADREFDYWDTDDPSESSQIQIDNVNVVSIKSQALEQVIACVSAAGRRCEVVDGLPLALARALELSGEDSPQTPVGIVDWGYSGATVCAVRGGRPLFTRYLRDCGYSLLLSAVANALGLTLAEAQEVLSVYGLPAADEPSDVQDAILEIAGSHLQHLAGQLIKTSAYLRVQRPPLLPTRYWLLGGGATIRNIDAFLSPRLGVPCAVWQLAGSLGPHPVQMFGPALALSALRWT